MTQPPSHHHTPVCPFLLVAYHTLCSSFPYLVISTHIGSHATPFTPFYLTRLLCTLHMVGLVAAFTSFAVCAASGLRTPRFVAAARLPALPLPRCHAHLHTTPRGTTLLRTLPPHLPRTAPTTHTTCYPTARSPRAPACYHTTFLPACLPHFCLPTTTLRTCRGLLVVFACRWVSRDIAVSPPLGCFTTTARVYTHLRTFYGHRTSHAFAATARLLHLDLPFIFWLFPLPTLHKTGSPHGWIRDYEHATFTTYTFSPSHTLLPLTTHTPRGHLAPITAAFLAFYTTTSAGGRAFAPHPAPPKTPARCQHVPFLSGLVAILRRDAGPHGSWFVLLLIHVCRVWPPRFNLPATIPCGILVSGSELPFPGATATPTPPLDCAVLPHHTFVVPLLCLR